MAERNMTLPDLYTLHPLGCDHFGAEWLDLWLALGRLLRKPARLEYYGDASEWEPDPICDSLDVASCLIEAVERLGEPENVRGFERIRVVLLTGTVIREWS